MERIVTTRFSIDVGPWETSEYGPDFIRETTSALTIACDGKIATRNFDNRSRTMRDSIRVAAYPFALWLAYSWWRIRWEMAGCSTRQNTAWRLAHEVAAAAGGYMWPRMAMAWDGVAITLDCSVTDDVSYQPIRFLERFSVRISADDFESAADGFVSLVVDRLNAVQIRNTDLHRIWNELRDERTNKTVSAHRRMEAQLGFDPDAVPHNVINQFMSLGETVGEAAAAEIAFIFSGKLDHEHLLAGIASLPDEPGITGQISLSTDLRESLEIDSYHPWEAGRSLAHRARKILGCGDTFPVEDGLFDNIFSGRQIVALASDARPSRPFGLAIRQQRDVKLLLRKRTSTGRRFELARIFADNFFAPSTDTWLPATDTESVRQKIQRAFAAEFLCPINALQDYMAEDFSEEKIENAGKQFQVSPLTVRSHLANNNLIPHDEVYA